MHAHQAQPGDVRVGDRRPVHRIGLEHREGVERQRRSDGVLDVGEAHVVMVEESGLFGLDPAQQLPHRFPRVEPHPDGQRVDEQPDHGFDAGDVRWATRHGAAEHDVAAAGGGAQHDRPRGLHHRVQRDAPLPADRLQPGGAGDVERDVDLGGHGGLFAAAVERRQQCRFVETGERSGPRSHPGLRILCGDPCQVVPVGVHPRQHGGVAVRGVQGEQLLHHQRCRPAVEQDVVVGQDQPVLVRAGPHQQEPDQRGLRHVEASGPVVGDQPRQFGLPHRLVVLGQVDLVPRQRHPLLHHLDGGAVGPVHERGPQVGMAVEHRLPGPPQPAGVGAAHVEHHLHQVGVDRAVGQLGVEQQTRLQGRERPHVGEVREALLERLDLRLPEVDQIQIRRAQSARPRPGHVPGQRDQGLGPQPGQLGDVRDGQDAGREAPRGADPGSVGPVGGDRVDVEDRRDRQVGVLQDAQVGIVGRYPAGGPLVLRDRRGEPAQVVEAHLRRRQAAQRASALVVEVPQHPVSDAVVGHRQQLFLDGLDRRAGAAPAREGVVDVDSGQVQPDREQGGEPPDGPREVRAGQHVVLAPVTLERHQRGVGVDAMVPAPADQCHRQRGEQAVVDAAAERVRHRRQQRVGHVG